MNKQIEQLIVKRDFHLAESEKYKKAIEALRLVCEHKWQYTGHGHNDSHYLCSECRAEKWE